MTNSIAEMLLGYGFAIALFAGLPAIVFLIVFLPALMRTTGEAIGASGPDLPAVSSRRLPLPRLLPRPRTLANTA
jgi:hypothetical protein